MLSVPLANHLQAMHKVAPSPGGRGPGQDPDPGGLLGLLLLQCGDVERNPGPPRRNPAASGAPKKEPTKEEKEADAGSKVKEYEEKIHRLEKFMEVQRQEMESLKNKMKNLEGVDEKLLLMGAKIDAITDVYDEMHEKMHEIDKSRENNLLFYGIKPDFLPEIPAQLEQKIHEIIKANLNISRDVPVTKISRMITGPEVRGCRPVLVNFVHWKDREEVLRKCSFLRGANIYITEDLSRKMREHRQELHKYARQIRSRSPNKKCSLRQDKLFIDNHMFVYDEERREVVRHVRPASPPRAPSRNYSGVDDSLRRSTSVHSVNGEAANGGHDHGGSGSPRTLLPGSASSLGPGRTYPASAGPKYPSTESLHLTQGHSGHGSEVTHQTGDVVLTLNGPKIAATIPEKEEDEEEEKEEIKEEKVPPKAIAAAKPPKRIVELKSKQLVKAEENKKGQGKKVDVKKDKVVEENEKIEVAEVKKDHNEQLNNKENEEVLENKEMAAPVESQ